MNRSITTLALASIIVMGASACGSSNTNSASTASSMSATTGSSMTESSTAPAVFNAADETFAQSMIPHHQQAVAMADLALASTANASTAVKDLATRIKGAQGPEIEMMQGWLTMWGAPMMTDAPTPMTSTGEMPMGTDATSGTTDRSMNGMMSSADLASLAAATGTDFDTMWLTMMVEHHQGAVTMSMTEQQDGSNPDAKTLAGKIITAQNAEIAEMNKLLDK